MSTIMHANQPKKKIFTYIIFYKPYGVLSQFTDESERRTLSNYGPFPKQVYPVGRLDAESEGLLLLTDDDETKRILLEPRYGHRRTYLVQVEGLPNDLTILKLKSGVLIDGTTTKKAEVRRIEREPELPPREVPIRFRKNIPTTWLELTLTEGRNRQVRRMTASVGHPTLRLLRISHGTLTLGTMKPGEHRSLTATEVRDLLHSLSGLLRS